jgi:hypothetical protein
MHTLCALTCLLLFFFFKGVREAGTVGYSPQRDARVAYRSEPIHSVEWKRRSLFLWPGQLPSALCSPHDGRRWPLAYISLSLSLFTTKIIRLCNIWKKKRIQFASCCALLLNLISMFYWIECPTILQLLYKFLICHSNEIRQLIRSVYSSEYIRLYVKLCSICNIELDDRGM